MALLYRNSSARTNKPLDHLHVGDGEERLLWAKDKWLIAHKEAPVVQRGAYPGLHGETMKSYIEGGSI